MPAVVAPLAGGLAGRIGARPMLVTGMVQMTVGVAWVAAVATANVLGWFPRSWSAASG